MKNVFIGIGDRPAPDKEMIKTKTGEFFQPIRLYYRVKSMTGIRVAFNKLRCIDYEPDDNHWVWVYENEAKKINFEIHHAALHSDDKPLILGILSHISDEYICLDVGSIERALKAIEFFDRHIKKYVAKIEFVASYNKLPKNRSEYPGIRFDKLFCDVDIHNIEHQIDEKLIEIERARESGGLAELVKKFEFNLVETFIVECEQESLSFLSMSLRMRQALAMARRRGDTKTGLFDIIQSFAKFMAKKTAH